MNWKKVKLGSILTESKVISENPDTNKRIKVRLKVLGVEKRGIENEVEGATKQFIRRAGQFIFGKQNFHKGAFGIVPDELDGFESSSDLPAFDIDKSCLPEFLFYFFKQGNYYLELSKIAYGVATQRINMKEFFELEIPLPDIEIQKQIISQFKTLENGGLKISSELTHQLNLIKQMRQAFLREAMQGKLVKSTNTKETGQQLLAKIKAEKAKLIADKKLKKDPPAGRAGKELAPISENEIPFEIPEHWAWCRLGEVLDILTDYHANGGYEKLKENVELLDKDNFAIMLRTTNFHPKKYFNYKYITEEAYNFLDKSKVFAGDLIMNKIGDPGSVFFVDERGKPMSLAMNLFLLRFSKNVSNFYMYSYLEMQKGYVKSFAKGSTSMTITKDAVKELIIPLPPLYEQEQIVAKLEDLMAFCDGLEQSIKESQGYNEMLLQQVLREALQGERRVI